MERTEDRRLHLRRAGIGLDGEIGGAQRRADIYGAARPFRPVDPHLGADIGLHVGDQHAVRIDSRDREGRNVIEQHEIGEAAGRDGTDPLLYAHVARRIDGRALDGDFGREAVVNGVPDIVVGGAQLKRFGCTTIVGSEGDV